MSNPRVILMSGVNGAGKTTEALRLAKEIGEDRVVVIAVNDYFLDEAGVFHYFHMAYPYAQEDAKGKFAYALMRAEQDGTQAVIVEDIFASVTDLSHYVSIAFSYGYAIEVVTMECDPATAIARQVHNMRPGYIVSRERDLRSRVIPEGWTVHQRTFKTGSIG